MAFQVSPGVNVSEIDLTTVVPAVSTTTGAFAGHFSWGPIDQRVLIDSEDRLVNVFQKPNSNTATDFFTASNFLAYGNQLFVTRVVDGANNATSGADGAYISNEDYYDETYAHSTGHGDWVAKWAGELGNSLEVSVCQSKDAWESTVSGAFYYATRNSSTVTLGGDSDTTIGLAGSNSEANFIVGDIILLGPDKQPRKIKALSGNTITLTSDYTGNTVQSYEGTITRRWEYFDTFDNAPTTTQFANTNNSQGDSIHIAVIDQDGLFSGAQGTVLEKYEDVSVASDAKTEQGATNYYKEVINQQSAYLWWGAHNASLTNAGKASSGGISYGGKTTPVVNSMTGGKDGLKPTGAQKIAGYNKYKSSEDVDVSLILGGEADQTLATHLITNIAESRKDCIVVISPERADVVNNNAYDGKERDDIIAFRDLLPSSSYAVMDSGWKYQYDKYNDLYRYVPMNADTAGLMVQTDLTRDPWYSPAGFNRGNVKNVIKLAYNPSKADRDQLYKKGVNPIVTFPGQGTVLYGDKTLLAKPSAFDRINVRRLFIVLEKAISTASRFTLFEFNDEFTRSQFKNLVEPFLRDVQGRRGITDFVVVCDGTNNTGEVIDRNEFVGDIYIKPARSINFIQLNFVAVRTGVEFSEIVGREG
jgi:phage tail sheath protein FI